MKQEPTWTLPLLTAVAALTALLGSGPVPAQTLPDPTRPMGAARPATPGNTSPAPVARLGAVNAAGNRAPAPARVVPPPQLQALMTPEDGPRSALLDGQLLLAGQTLGRDWRLERIGDDGVLLRRLAAAGPDTATLWLPLLAAPRLHKEP
ncbi:hypothetical protein ACWA7J_01555 [Leptothrix sp. BB-4]